MMGTIKIGDTVKMKNGGEAKLLSEFGSGGQGTVYKVSYNGKELQCPLSNRSRNRSRAPVVCGVIGY